MLRYKTETRPDLVALYDIRPGNRAGPFLQPRSPHGAIFRETLITTHIYWGTGIRGLMRGMATLPQGNQEKTERERLITTHMTTDNSY